MRIPTIQGIIRRRILLNYRVDPEVVRRHLPPPFEPKLHRGHAVAGICLIRLERLRPRGLPSLFGIASENSAHRIAVEWSLANGKSREGVFVPRRDTDQKFNVLAGGRIFPGVHFLSDFNVVEDETSISIRVTERKGNTDLLDLVVAESETLPDDSIFDSIEEASAFFEGGCLGYSSRPNSAELDGLELRIDNWKVSPLSISRAESSFYDDRSLFPEESIRLDHALLMRDIPHQWHSLPGL